MGLSLRPGGPFPVFLADAGGEVEPVWLTTMRSRRGRPPGTPVTHRHGGGSGSTAADSMRPVKQSAVFRLALLALIWGSSFLWIKLADRGFAPVEVTFARLALGAAALFPVVAVPRRRDRKATAAGR
jgi:hypothetical protein